MLELCYLIQLIQVEVYYEIHTGFWGLGLKTVLITLHWWDIEITCIYSVIMIIINIHPLLSFLIGLLGNFKFTFVAHICIQCPISIGKHCVRGTR